MNEFERLELVKKMGICPVCSLPLKEHYKRKTYWEAMEFTGNQGKIMCRIQQDSPLGKILFDGVESKYFPSQ